LNIEVTFIAHLLQHVHTRNYVYPRVIPTMTTKSAPTEHVH